MIINKEHKVCDNFLIIENTDYLHGGEKSQYYITQNKRVAP